MLMHIDTTIIIFVIGLMIEVIFSLFENKYLMAIPITISSIIFIITKDINWYNLAFYQVIICFISISLVYVVKAILKNKRISEIDKTKIKDLS